MAAEFQIYPSGDGHRWRLFETGNSRIIANGGQEFSTKQGAKDAVANVKAEAQAAPVVEKDS